LGEIKDESRGREEGGEKKLLRAIKKYYLAGKQVPHVKAK
jgi:hypothetical protein